MAGRVAISDAEIRLASPSKSYVQEWPLNRDSSRIFLLLGDLR